MNDRIEKLQELLKKNPGDNFLKHALALEYMKLGQDPEARILFEEILTHDSDYLGSYYQFAKLLETNNETVLAISYYEKGMMVAKKLGDLRTYNELHSAYQELTD
jgi:Tfp pilus assembly protein PilF